MANPILSGAVSAGTTTKSKPLVVSTPTAAVKDYNKITSDVKNISSGVQKQVGTGAATGATSGANPTGGSASSGAIAGAQGATPNAGAQGAMAGAQSAAPTSGTGAAQGATAGAGYVQMLDNRGDPIMVPKDQEQTFLNSGFRYPVSPSSSGSQPSPVTPSSSQPEQLPAQPSQPSQQLSPAQPSQPPQSSSPNQQYNTFQDYYNQYNQETTPINTQPDLTEFNAAQARIDETQRQYQEELRRINERTDAAFNEFKTATDQLRNGTFPLTPDQQMQIKGMQDSFDRLRRQQEEANKNYVAGITQAGIVSGRSRYAPEMELGNIANAVNVGIQKIADLDSKASLTLAELRQNMQDKNYSLVKEQYLVLKDYLNEKNATISKIYEKTLEYEREMRDINYKLAQDTVDNQLKSQQLNMQQKRDVFERAMASAQFDADQRRQIAEEYYRQQEFEMKKSAYDKDTARSEIERLAASGYSLDQFSPELIDSLEKSAGFTPGTFQTYYNTMLDLQEMQRQNDAIGAQEKIIDLLSKIPGDREISIPGYGTFSGLKEVDFMKGVNQFTEKDAYGNITQVTTRYNPQTGRTEVVSINNLGTIGTPQDSALDVQRQQLELMKLQNEIFGVPGTEGVGNKIFLDRKEAASMNKEIINSDAYKGLERAKDLAAMINNYENLFNKYGNQKYGKAAQELGSSYTSTLLGLKELFNLGVLNGPDLELMQKVLVDPRVNFATDPIKFTKIGGEKGIKAGIEQVKELLIERVGDRYKQLITSYRDYDPSQLTNLQNARNLYENVTKNNAEFILKDRVKKDPGLLNTITEIRQKYNAEPYEILQLLDEQSLGQQSFNQPLSTDLNGSIKAQAVTKFPPGSTGGQCGVFAHKLVQFPPVGNGKLEKYKSVDKFGIQANQWRQNPRVGDVIITDENPTYGHVAVVSEILPNGTIRLIESNYRGDEKVTYNRTIPLNSNKIYGAIRGPLKV